MNKNDLTDSIELELDRNSRGIEEIEIFPELGIAVYSVAVKTAGMFSSSANLESQVIPLSDMDLSSEQIQSLKEDMGETTDD